MKLWPFIFHFFTLASATSSVESSVAPGPSVTTSSTGSTPTCLQPRKSQVPSAAAISSALASAIPSACSTANQKIDSTSTPNLVIDYYDVDSFNFNISHKSGNSPANPPVSDCSDTFNAIIKSCVNSAQQNGFWGGWEVKGGLNYSISNFAYPANGLIAPSRSSTSSPSSAVHSSQGTRSGTGTRTSASQKHSTLSSATKSGSGGSGGGGPSVGLSQSKASTSQSKHAGSATGSPSNSQKPTTNSRESASSPSRGPDSSSHSISQSTGGSGKSSASISNGSSRTTPAGSNTATYQSDSTSKILQSPSHTSSSTGRNSASGSTSRPESASNRGSASGPAPSSSIPIPVISPVSAGSQEIYQVASGIVATGNPTDIIIGGETLIPGGTPYTSSGHTVALETDGIVEVNGKPEQLGTPSGARVPPKTSSATSAASNSLSKETGHTSPSQSGNTKSTNQGTSQGQTSNGSPPQTTVPPIASTSGGIDTTLITGTITSAPTDFSTEKVSNTEWTGNTYITTEKDGHSTIVPVIVGCPGCGGIHGGIILWGLPPIPDVSFQFPKFPGLPHIHLPCIKIFGVKVSGDCDSPPQDDNKSDEDPDSTDSEPSKTSDSPSSTKASTTGPKSTTASTTSSSSRRSTSSASSSRSSSSSSAASGCYEPLLPSGSGVAKRAVSDAPPGDSCPYTCPATLPQAPTTGPLAVSMPTPDPGDVEKRALAGRFRHVIDKRGKAKPIANINGCVLQTPANLPVTTPAYPGGYEFWTSETNGVLPASYQALSRYYRTTPSGCLPTITKVPAAQLHPVQNAADINEENSVDHACESFPYLFSKKNLVKLVLRTLEMVPSILKTPTDHLICSR